MTQRFILCHCVCFDRVAYHPHWWVWFAPRAWNRNLLFSHPRWENLLMGNCVSKKGQNLEEWFLSWFMGRVRPTPNPNHKSQIKNHNEGDGDNEYYFTSAESTPFRRKSPKRVSFDPRLNERSRASSRASGSVIGPRVEDYNEYLLHVKYKFYYHIKIDYIILYLYNL